MAIFHSEFFSVAMRGLVHFEAVVPNDLPDFMKAGNPNYERPTKLLILLHGFNGSYTDWLYGSNISELSGKYNLVIVTPDGGNRFWLDDDAGFARCGTYVGEELVNYARKTFGLSAAREDTLIGGYSMGGFGALHTAAVYPETFDKCFAFSSAMILEEVSRMKPGEANAVLDYEGYVRIFGRLEDLEKSRKNPKTVLRQLKESGSRIPDIYLACGLEDFLLPNNRELRDFLQKEEIPFEYHESHGIHNWAFWQSWLEPAIQWMLGIAPESTEDTIHLIGEEKK